MIGIGVTNLVFIPLHGPLGLGPLTSVTIATVVATVVTFLGNRYWSFRHREGGGTAKEGVTFLMLNGVGLLIQYAVLGFSNYALGLTTKLENVIALNLGIGIGTLFRFWSYRKWVWVPPDSAAAAAQARQASQGPHRPCSRGRRASGRRQRPAARWGYRAPPVAAHGGRARAARSGAAAARMLEQPVHRYGKDGRTAVLAQHAGGDQPADHVSLARAGEVGVLQRVISGRRLHQASQDRRLRPGQRSGPTAEVAATRLLDAVIAMPEVGDVGVHAQDLLARCN